MGSNPTEVQLHVRVMRDTVETGTQSDSTASGLKSSIWPMPTTTGRFPSQSVKLESSRPSGFDSHWRHQGDMRPVTLQGWIGYLVSHRKIGSTPIVSTKYTEVGYAVMADQSA